MTFWLCDYLTMSTLCDFFIFIFSCLLSVIDSACLPTACFLLSFLLIFASSLKHYYCPLLFAIESCHDVHLRVTSALPTAFLKKRRDDTVNSLYHEVSRLENLWVLQCPFAWFLYVHSDSFTVTKYSVSIRRNKHMMMMWFVLNLNKCLKNTIKQIF